MIRKILIANRGEIACRIIRTCREMGIRTVAVYSDVDKNALHVEMADEAVHIGASPASASYLNIEAIINAAQQAAADAIHPGYGFLAENATFAQAVLDAGLVFIGPTPQAIEAMGDKKAAKNLLQGIPYVTGYIGDAQDDATFIAEANTIGYPIMVKAAAGGGGKGMRLVEDATTLPDALAAARREAQQAFGDDTLMLEKAIIKPRHIEVQILGDTHGNVIALGERECSIQRRHQKIVEESPAYGLSDDLRAAIHDTAVQAANQLNYTNAGTIEFLLDRDDNFYFMEMNTRLQVEHPVTEAVYGIDLVRWQIMVAEGASIAELAGIQPQGHAIEVRVYAEDPYNNFLPVTGQILHWKAPDSVRTDSGVRSGDAVTSYYDPMLAKIIAHCTTRTEAIRKLDYALAQLQFIGMRNNVSFLQQVITHPEHVAGNISTHFLTDYPIASRETLPDIALIAAAISKQGGNLHWRNNPNRPIRQQFAIGDTHYEIYLQPVASNQLSVQLGDKNFVVEAVADGLIVNGHRQAVTVVNCDDDFWVHTLADTYQLQWRNPLPVPSSITETQGSLRAPMPGQVIQVLVEVGQAVEQGTLLMIMEAMKMEHRIEAPYSGTITAIRYAIGDTVQADETLLVLED